MVIVVSVPAGNQGSTLTLADRGFFFMEMCDTWLGFF